MGAPELPPQATLACPQGLGPLGAQALQPEGWRRVSGPCGEALQQGRFRLQTIEARRQATREEAQQQRGKRQQQQQRRQGVAQGLDLTPQGQGQRWNQTGQRHGAEPTSPYRVVRCATGRPRLRAAASRASGV